MYALIITRFSLPVCREVITAARCTFVDIPSQHSRANKCTGPGASCVHCIVHRCVAGGSDACDMTSQEQPPGGISKRGHLFSYWCTILTHDKQTSVRTDGEIYRQARTVAVVKRRRLLWFRHAITWKGNWLTPSRKEELMGQERKEETSRVIFGQYERTD